MQRDRSPQKNPHAVALGKLGAKLGGQIGGKSRSAKKVAAARRNAAKARKAKRV